MLLVIYTIPTRNSELLSFVYWAFAYVHTSNDNSVIEKGIIKDQMNS